MSVIETSFDQYRDELAGLLKKIDVDLAMRIMHFERKVPDVEPRVELLVTAKHGTNLANLAYAISSKLGFQTMVQGHHILVVGRATIDDVYKLSENPVIEFIDGSVTIASY